MGSAPLLLAAFIASQISSFGNSTVQLNSYQKKTQKNIKVHYLVLLKYH